MMDWKKLAINAVLAALWYALGQFQVLDAAWAAIVVAGLRFVIGWIAARFGVPVPVDSR